MTGRKQPLIVGRWAMLAEAEVQEYLDEIRKEVCSRCVERPAGGPPCGPLGKPCGVELHLEKLIDAVRNVHSGLIGPYLDNNRKKICAKCANLHDCDYCPCPMDSLAVLVVGAIEAVNERHRGENGEFSVKLGLPCQAPPDVEEVACYHDEATGKWTGCDWPTAFGPRRLNLQGWTSDGAETLALAAGVPEEREAWEQAADWLREIERRAKLAESEASQAVADARDGKWNEAAEHAFRAWAIEFSTGRPLRHSPATWHRFHEIVEASAVAVP
jgi:hypothetical protein